jgi:nitrate/TMAO reductase-like tetraheme cytochrome c subunit
MSSEPSPSPRRPFSLLRNWVSLNGLVIVLGSLFTLLLLSLLDLLAPTPNPYIGVLTYLVVPVFLIIGLLLTGIGALLERRQIIRAAGAVPAMVINLTHPEHRRRLMLFVAGVAVVLLVAATGTYHSYHFTESTTFCGQACHPVMKPEMVAYQHGAHARVSCTECHIGPGATWFVRSKLSGTYQVYATLAKKYPRPVPTPIKNLRPAQETCEQCHWPAAFVGNLDRTFTSFLGDESNSVHSIRMLMKVGGADLSHGPVGGIHWHMNVGNVVEYIATDEGRQKIPWVRVVSVGQGVVTEFRSPNFTNDVSGYPLRRMDCMDCHNRPAHMFESPNSAINLAMALGRVDASLPYVKTNAVFALTRPYTNEVQALQRIATFLAGQYPEGRNDPRVTKAIDAVQTIYKENFFPEMNASWRAYPDNIGHKDWPGCFRCHDGKHTTADGKNTIKANDCSACHVILAQGSGEELNQLDAHGREFKHPGDPLDKGSLCHDCHTGE